jgi:thiamine pyrophosphate-dependent acetolactate synthase large subunit-like protein
VSATLKRREVVAKLLADRSPDLLVVCGLGAPVFDVTAVGDHPLNFPLWGGMGAAMPVGIGLALAQPDKRVLVVTGDGEMLMGLGSLGTAAAQRPENLVCVVIDNERYGETGMQVTHTASVVDLAGVAKSCGWADAVKLTDMARVASFAPKIKSGRGPIFACIKVTADPEGFALPPREGAHLQMRFRQALLGPDAALT